MKAAAVAAAGMTTPPNDDVVAAPTEALKLQRAIFDAIAPSS
jgi:hypothetical protein